LNNLLQLRDNFQSKSKGERILFLKSLSIPEQLYFYKNPDLFLFDKQIIPETNDWVFYLLRCGRGFGKSYAGSAWISKKIRKGAKILGLCGPTYDDVSKIMVPAILSWFLSSELADPPYNHQTHTVKFKNGAKIYCYTSEKEIKGPNLEYLWCDEIATWCDSQSEKIAERFEDITRGVRSGPHPQTIITSTPKSHKFFWDFQEEIDKGNDIYQMQTGTMFDNPFLPKSFIDAQLAKYGNSPRGRQELYGDLITENPEALFKMQWINENRCISTSPQYNPTLNHDLDIKYFFSLLNPPKRGEEPKIHLKRLAIAVDPSGSNKKTSDETGILLLAQDISNEIYVLYDLSGRHTPDEWARIVRNLYNQYHKLAPTIIVAETNFGGDIVISNICAADHTLRPYIKEVKAFKSKLIRAEPAAAKYQRGKIHHVGHFEKLERQMCNYIGKDDSYSPDRMDALVHGINELIVVPQYTYRDLSAFNSQ
jgi:phage terminase large subunit-like protein